MQYSSNYAEPSLTYQTTPHVMVGPHKGLDLYHALLFTWTKESISLMAIVYSCIYLEEYTWL